MTNAQRASASAADPDLVWVGARVDAALAGLLTSGVNGGHARLHAPSPVQPGSSVSHFSTDAFPDQLMEPSYTGPNHDPGMAMPLLCDLGWPCTVAPTPVPALSRMAWAALLGLLGAIGTACLRRPRA
jgi:hypothetical protein